MLDDFVRGMSHPFVYRCAGLSAAFCAIYGPISVWGLPHFPEPILPVVASGLAVVVGSVVPLVGTLRALKANQPIEETK